MSTARKRSLPTVSSSEEKSDAASSASAPRVDAARKRLGGRASTNGDAGRIVEVTTPEGEQSLGVVLFGAETELHVWLDGGTVWRIPKLAASPAFGPVPDDFVRIAADARVFATLREGDVVRYEGDPGTFSEAKLVEKCRYGALLLREDGTVMAVGFRKLWPAVSRSAPAN